MGKVLVRGLMLGASLLFALAVTGVFLLLANFTGRNSQIDLTVGAAWAFTLSLIISSPLLIPRIKKMTR